MVLILNHFWRHIFKRPTKGVSLLHAIGLDAPAEIADFYDVAVFDEYIFWLNISMNKPLLMHIINPTADLYKKVKRRIFAQKLFLSDKVEQISFTRIFEREVYCGFVFETGV